MSQEAQEPDQPIADTGIVEVNEPDVASAKVSQSQRGGKKFTRNRKRVTWTIFEESALSRGVAKYGTLKHPWSSILADPELKDTLALRSNVDIKDKWRNMKNAKANGRVTMGTTLENLSPKSQEIRQIREQEMIEKRNAEELDPIKSAKKRAKRSRFEKYPQYVFIIRKKAEFIFTNDSKKSNHITSPKIIEGCQQVVNMPKETIFASCFVSVAQANLAMINAFRNDLKDNFNEEISELLEKEQNKSNEENTSSSSSSSSEKEEEGYSFHVDLNEGNRFEYSFPKGIQVMGGLRKNLKGKLTYIVSKVTVDHTPGPMMNIVQTSSSSSDGGDPQNLQQDIMVEGTQVEVDENDLHQENTEEGNQNNANTAEEDAVASV
mmetsp:Transcript_42261/g.54411  ORF Transcript_42261/g.54411 Transcript_42261/m.54411 type:complete len:378 (+) Transcript_42261:73-1206(+)